MWRVCFSQLSRWGRKMAAPVTGVCVSHSGTNRTLFSLFPRRHVLLSFLAFTENTEPHQARGISLCGGDTWKGEALIFPSHVPMLLIFENSEALCSGGIFLILVASTTNSNYLITFRPECPSKCSRAHGGFHFLSQAARLLCYCYYLTFLRADRCAVWNRNIYFLLNELIIENLVAIFYIHSRIKKFIKGNIIKGNSERKYKTRRLSWLEPKPADVEKRPLCDSGSG